MKGLFFVVEGMDGAGTTTQSRLLKTKLESVGRKVHLTSEPTAGAIGKVIRSYLAGNHQGKNAKAILALLFAADRLSHHDDEIEPMLKQGFDVVSDRYLMSSMVYQGLDLPAHWVASLNEHALSPDLTVVLDVPVDTAIDRRATRGGHAEIFEKDDLQAQIRTRYLKFAEQKNVALVDGQGELSAVSERVFEVVRQKIV